MLATLNVRSYLYRKNGRPPEYMIFVQFIWIGSWCDVVRLFLFESPVFKLFDGSSETTVT